MTQHIFRASNTDIRENLSYDERWNGVDHGLITCWEAGRLLSNSQPEIAKKANSGELPVLPWKGGIEKETKNKEKYGTLFYLAQWQGLRGEDLNIDLDKEISVTCSKTEITVIFTDDSDKYNKT